MVEYASAMTDQPATPINDDAARNLVAAYDEAAEPTSEEKAAGMMTDAFLIRAYQRANGVPGDPEAEALLAEITRRGLKL